MKPAKEKIHNILIWAGRIIIGLAVLCGIFYYLLNNSEYSTKILEKDTMVLVDEILENNCSSAKCVKISGLPDEFLAMMNEYELEATLDNGRKLPVKVTRIRKNGNFRLQVELRGKIN